MARGNKVVKVHDPVNDQTYHFLFNYNGIQFHKWMCRFDPKAAVHDPPDDKTIYGCCYEFAIENKHAFAIWIPRFKKTDLNDINTLTHECVHAALMSLKFRGYTFDDPQDETPAYLVAFLVEQALRGFNGKR